ncbi:regulator of nonsense transcripts 3A-like [Agrilus planipennis]|uniref:Regulator of nonsense transcripts 3A-like n=1 Tax=Agrilus planipennis TaxID=224129 RepID=A0A1W4W638_AGRPL|nr:regulator of nonsense transcripts 3A-like [Agrilus planipennis]
MDRKGKNCQNNPKLVIRRLPPFFTLKDFKEHFNPLPAYTYFYFVPSEGNEDEIALYSRAYIQLTDLENIFKFRDKYDNSVIVGPKGEEYRIVVEYAPFQQFPPKRSRKIFDKECGTIEDNDYYILFLQNLQRLKRESKLKPPIKFNICDSTSSNKDELTPLLKYISKHKMRPESNIELKQKQKNNCIIFVNSSVKKSGGSKRFNKANPKKKIKFQPKISLV